MTDWLRSMLRGQSWWIQLRELEREGVIRALRRDRIQRVIDRTPPVVTDTQGPIELRVLTWRRDWRNAIWALKSFYAYSGVTYPLFIHDGGWQPDHARELQRHFPNAVLVGERESDDEVEAIMRRHGWTRSLEYRRKNGLTRQLFDFFLLSRAEHVIILGSDLLFFKQPAELISPNGSNLYARDSGYFYSMSLDDIESSIGIRPIPYFNTGPCVVRRTSLDFDVIEQALHQEQMFEDNWVTEQTLHAICGTVYGADYLPPTYIVEPTAGDPATLVCKHYPGLFRHRMHEEGMKYLIADGFVDRLERKFGAGHELR